MIRIKVPLEVIDRELITTLVAAIIFRVHLNGVVRQMNEPRGQISQIELL